MTDTGIRKLVQEIADSSPLAGELPIAPAAEQKRASNYPVLAAALAAVAAVAVAGSVAYRMSEERIAADRGGLLVQHDEPPPPTEETTASTTTTNPVDLKDPSHTGLVEFLEGSTDWQRETLGGDMWLTLRSLPPGVEFESATDGHAFRQVVFEGSDDVSIGVMLFISPPEGFGERGQTVDVDGVQWTSAESLGLSRMIGDIAVSVSGVGVSTEQLLGAVASLAVVSESDLPLPALYLFNDEDWTEVGSVTFDGFQVALDVKTDGRRYITRLGSNSGTGGQLTDDDPIVISRWAGPGSIRDAPPGYGVLVATVNPSVETVEVEFSGGSTLVSEPQGKLDEFPVNFVLTAIPGSDHTAINTVERLIAYDASGARIGEARWP